MTNKPVALFAVATLLTACGGVQVAPTPALPRALVKKLPLKVGVVLTPEATEYKHKETRGGVTWEIALGPGHQKFVTEVMNASFEAAPQFKSLDDAKKAQGLAVIFEPRIDQFSFATSRDTGGNYYAATIQYRIHVFNAAGERVDSFSLTGYGNALAGGTMSGSEKPLAAAASSAMRDAAAKFIVQFPDQKIAQQLLKGESLLAAGNAAKAPDAFAIIEAVPIKDL